MALQSMTSLAVLVVVISRINTLPSDQYLAVLTVQRSCRKLDLRHTSRPRKILREFRQHRQ